MSGLVQAGMTSQDISEEALESRSEAAPAILVVIALQLLLALVSRENGWTLWGLPWWTWLVAIAPELGQHEVAE